MAKFVATAYGPPWNSMNGTGVTKGGTDLRPNKKAYLIAADPSVLPLGTMVTVWPNPFGYKGAFKVDDIGGAIKGNRIDIYDWRGRAYQYRWGRRTVEVNPIGGNLSVGTNGGGGSGGLAVITGGGLPDPMDALGPIGQLASDLYGGTAGTVETALETPGAIADGLKAIAEAFAGFSGFLASFFSFITTSSNWLRLGKIALGILLVIIGTMYMFRTLITSNVSGAIKSAAKGKIK